MRFTVSTKPQQSLAGTTRTVKRFAWKPVHIGFTIVWLEYYYVLQIAQNAKYQAMIGGEAKDFIKTSWIDISEQKSSKRK